MKGQRLKKTLLVILIIFIGFLVYYFYIMTSNKKVIELNKELKTKQLQIKELNDLNKKKGEIEKKIKNLEKRGIFLEQKIPSYNCIDEFTRDLYTLTNSKEIKTDKININPSPEKGDYGIIKVSFDTSGSMEDIKRAVNYFNDYKRKLSIKTFRLQAQPDGTYSASMNVELYHQKE